jgi:hypothetical protein
MGAPTASRLDAQTVTILTGEVLLAIAQEAAGAFSRHDVDEIAGDVALALVECDPRTEDEARTVARRAANASRMREVRRTEVATHGMDHVGAALAASKREWLHHAIEFRTRHGRPPSRTTLWRMCRSLKQNG